MSRLEPPSFLLSLLCPPAQRGHGVQSRRWGDPESECETPSSPKSRDFQEAFLKGEGTPSRGCVRVTGFWFLQGLQGCWAGSGDVSSPPGSGGQRETSLQGKELSRVHSRFDVSHRTFIQTQSIFLFFIF